MVAEPSCRAKHGEELSFLHSWTKTKTTADEKTMTRNRVLSLNIINDDDDNDHLGDFVEGYSATNGGV